MHVDFNAADRAANVLVSAPVTPPVRIQEGRPAPSTLEKLPERGLRQGVVHAKVEPEREPKVVCSNSCVSAAPRKNEVNQQQDWRLVFVDRPETEQITDCLDAFCSARTLALTETDCPGASVHLRAGACPRSATRYVCERSRQDQNRARRALLSALLKRRCLLTATAADAQATTRHAAASTEGDRRSIEDENFDVLIFARSKMGFDQYVM